MVCAHTFMGLGRSMSGRVLRDVRLGRIRTPGVNGWRADFCNRRTRNLVGAPVEVAPRQLSAAPNGQPVAVRTKQPDRSETHQRWCSWPDRRGRLQRFGHRPHTDQHLGIRTPDRSLCAYRLHRQWQPSVFLSLLAEFVPAARLFTQTWLAARIGSSTPTPGLW